MDRCSRVRNLLQIAAETERATSLEQCEAHSELSKSNSSPNLHDSGIDVLKVPPIAKARQSKSFRLPQIHKSEHSHQRSPCELQLEISSLSISSDNGRLNKYAGSIHFLLPQRLAYAALTPSEIPNLKEDCLKLNAFVLSSYLHRQYAPLCADFGPVTINIVHRFCQVCLSIFPKKISLTTS